MTSRRIVLFLPGYRPALKRLLKIINIRAKRYTGDICLHMKNSEVYKAEVTYLERDHFSVLLGSPTKELSLNILVSHVPHGGRMS